MRAEPRCDAVLRHRREINGERRVPVGEKNAPPVSRSAPTAQLEVGIEVVRDQSAAANRRTRDISRGGVHAHRDGSSTANDGMAIDVAAANASIGACRRQPCRSSDRKAKQNRCFHSEPSMVSPCDPTVAVATLFQNEAQSPCFIEVLSNAGNTAPPEPRFRWRSCASAECAAPMTREAETASSASWPTDMSSDRVDRCNSAHDVKASTPEVSRAAAIPQQHFTYAACVPGSGS
jgi:hypothetical protein